MQAAGVVFPFDADTERYYSTEWWRDRTGIGQLAQVLHLSQFDLILMLAFYGDGSGEHGKGPMVVAGYLGYASDLWEMERRWCNELQASPRIAYFKASECKAEAPTKLTGQFLGWDSQQAQEKRRRLAQIVHDASPRLVALSSMIDWDEYRSIIGDGLVREVYYHPYFFCFHGITSVAIETARGMFRDGSNRVSFVFDTESNGCVDAIAQLQFERVKAAELSELNDNIGTTSWDTDLKFPSLQIADLLAWSVRRKAAGQQSPVLHLVRDPNRLAGCYERNADAARMASMVIELDAKAESMQSSK